MEDTYVVRYYKWVSGDSDRDSETIFSEYVRGRSQDDARANFGKKHGYRFFISSVYQYKGVL